MGENRIFDGRTGNPFEKPVIVGKIYFLKVTHQVDKIDVVNLIHIVEVFSF
jgi:DNA-directed RNA polymerase subunit beta